MPDPPKPKIRVVLKTGQKPEAEAPMLGFVRWKLVPLPTGVGAVEPGVHDEPGDAEPSTRTP